jgi:uncharacterized protein (UPF0332 family)
MSGMWERALANALSAHVLVGTGDTNSAVSRAYYASFCAARAALRYVHPDLDSNKTHAGVIRRFGYEIVVREGLASALGRILAQMERDRIDADYGDDAISAETAHETLARMRDFLVAIAAFIDRPAPFQSDSP